jgi:Hypothetical glycosyl hydrolase family 15
VVAASRRLALLCACIAALSALGLAHAGSARAATGISALRICTNCLPTGGDLSRYQYVILNAWDAPSIPALKAKNPAMKVLVYQDAAASYAYACHGGTDDRLLPAGVGYCAADSQHPEWFLKDTSSARVEFCDYPGTWQMDVGSAAYQTAWLASVSTMLKRDGWDGVMIDDVNSTERQHLCGKTLAAYPTDSAYEAATRSFLARIGPSLRSQGLLVLPNINYDCWEACWSSFIQYTSGAVREWWSKNSRGYGGHYGDNGWDWSDGFLRLTQQAGKIFIGITYAPADDVRSMRYARASFLLDWNGGPSALAFEPAQEATDPWNSEWTADLGAARGARYQVGLAWRRDFAEGTVVVNPSSSSSAVVALGGTYLLPDGSPVTTITLAPMTAAILRNVGPPAPPPPPPPPPPAPPAPPASPPSSAPTQIALTATIDRSGTVKLSWLGANGNTVEIFRNGTRVAVVENSGAYTERVRVKTGTYTYVVCESGGSRCSPAVTVPLPERRLASVHTRTSRHHLKHRRRSVWVLLFRSWP